MDANPKLDAVYGAVTEITGIQAVDKAIAKEGLPKVRTRKRYIPRTLHFSIEFVRKMIGVFTKAAHRALRKYLRSQGHKISFRLRGYRDAINKLTGLIAKDFYADLADKIQEAMQKADGTEGLVNKAIQLVPDALTIAKVSE